MNKSEVQPQVIKKKVKSDDLSEEKRNRKRKASKEKEKKRVESVLFFRESRTEVKTDLKNARKLKREFVGRENRTLANKLAVFCEQEKCLFVD